MIPPDSRQLFHDLLAPPEGCVLDRAVGTTFSLDLESLMMLPMAFLRQTGRLEENEPPDPVALLASLRRHADRLTVFCQAGQVALPKNYSKLTALLEPCVYEALAPHHYGAFHPKVWALRFLAEDGSVFYRLLVMSRNLTADRSWDLAVALDGKYRNDRQRHYRTNNPLSAFFHALPSLTPRNRRLPDERISQVKQVAEELRYVEFNAPDGFDFSDAPFFPSGYHLQENTPDPFVKKMDRMLVIAPFVEKRWLEEMHDLCGDVRLVSRLETLDTLPEETLQPCKSLHVLHRQASVDEDDAEDLLQGLHAKVFVMDDGWNTRLLIGSHNATPAAFERNVEFSVELRAKRSAYGVDALLQASKDKKNATVFADLLDRYFLSNRTEQSAPDETWDLLCLQMKRNLVEACFSWQVKEAEDANFYDFVLKAEADFALPVGCKLSAWPVSVDSSWQQPVLPGADTTFPPLTFESITSWTAFCLSRGQQQSVWVMNLPLLGAPENRAQRLLAQILENPAALLLLLLLMLGQDDEGFGGDVFSIRRISAAATSAELETPLLETLLRIAARQPSALRRVRDVLNDLEESPLLSRDLLAIWQPIWEAVRKEAEK